VDIKLSELFQQLLHNSQRHTRGYVYGLKTLAETSITPKEFLKELQRHKLKRSADDINTDAIESDSPHEPHEPKVKNQKLDSSLPINKLGANNIPQTDKIDNVSRIQTDNNQIGEVIDNKIEPVTTAESKKAEDAAKELLAKKQLENQQLLDIAAKQLADKLELIKYNMKNYQN
jgi:hypothetical protein